MGYRLFATFYNRFNPVTTSFPCQQGMVGALLRGRVALDQCQVGFFGGSVMYLLCQFLVGAGMDRKYNNPTRVTVESLDHANLQFTAKTTIPFQPYLQGFVQGTFIASHGWLGFYAYRLVQRQQVAVLKEDVIIGNSVRVQGPLVQVQLYMLIGGDLQAAFSNASTIDMDATQVDYLSDFCPRKLWNFTLQELIEPQAVVFIIRQQSM